MSLLTAKRVAAAVSLGLAPAGARAQKSVAPLACVFDTAAHRDTLVLEFSLRAFKGKETTPDPALTRGFGDMMRAHLAIPGTVGRLLYPNTYYPRLSPEGYTANFGTMQFDFAPTGEIRDLKWYAASFDPGTDDAIDKALQASIAADEPRDLAAGLAWKKQQLVRILFLATNDTALHAPLARIRAPMVRIDSGGVVLKEPSAVLVPRDMIRISSTPTRFDFLIDESGHLDRKMIQPIQADSPSDIRGAVGYFLDVQWSPFRAGGCPVPLMVHSNTWR